MSAAVLGAYALVSLGYFGVRLLPDPTREVLGTGVDPQIFIWSIAWWPHALLEGLNPFLPDVVWAPQGVNLAWTTSVPGIALAVAPVTLLFGPVAGYNAAALLLPALAAWTAYLLCRHVTGRFWPSLAGGYLFGFSSYMLGQQLGHLHMTSVFLVPLVALVVLRFVEGGLDGRGLALRLGVLLGAQAYLSTEHLFTVSVALVAAVGVAYATAPDTRPRLRALPRPLAGAFAVAAVVASPLLGHALAGFESGTLNPPDRYSGDLLNLLVPTRLVWVGGDWAAELTASFPGNDAERGAYLGLPALVVVAWFAVSQRRQAAARFLAASLLLTAAVSLGTALWVAGERVVPLPWELVARLPLFNNVLPVRISLYASLVAAVAVALWSASPRIPWRVRAFLASACVLFLVPTVTEPYWVMEPERPEFFADSHNVRACLVRGENVLIFPYGYRGSSMLWQAENDFWFRMAQGHLRPDTPESFLRFSAVRKLIRAEEDPIVLEIVALARAKRVSRILSVERYAHPSGEELEPYYPVQLLGGVLIAPACHNPPISAGS